LDLFGLFLYPQLNALRWGCPVLQFAPQINVLQTCYLVLQLVQVHRNGDGDSVVHNDDGDDDQPRDDDDVPSMDLFRLFLYQVHRDGSYYGDCKPHDDYDGQIRYQHQPLNRADLRLHEQVDLFRFLLYPHMNVLRGCLVLQLAPHMNVLRGCLVFQLAQVHRDSDGDGDEPR